ncbi:MAG: hypothetical protein J6J41_08685, partial [Clostridia bacterium]|nr:hypothetical protein [Clostridia bacterium]
LMIMLEQLLEAGIEQIYLIIGPEDQEEFDHFFAPLREEQRSALPADKRKYEDRIAEMRRHVTYVYQRERKGFGHAIWTARKQAEKEPVLLLLGDFVYRSRSAVNCCQQVIDAFKECGRTLVSIQEIPLSQVVHYGILRGSWQDPEEKLMKVDRMVEKPTDDYAREHLGVPDARGEMKYYATFGQYVLTPEVFSELDREIEEGAPSEGREFGLTRALDTVCGRNGMYAFVPEGSSYDIGLPEAYRRTMWEFAEPISLR